VCNQNKERLFKVEERRRRGVVMSKYIYVALIAAVVFMSGTAQAVIMHQWTFNDGTANDYVGGANGTLMAGAAVSNANNGTLVTSVNGDYLSLPGSTIAINTYSEVTLALWETNPPFNQGYSMTAAFGNLANPGNQYVAIATTRGDNISRSMITDASTNPGYTTERGVNGAELNDCIQHLYVLTIGALECCADTPMITLYIDGVIRGFYNLDGRTLSGVSTNFAALMKGTYTADGTVIGEVDQFDIYDNAMNCEEVLALYQAGPVLIPEPATLVLLGLGSVAFLRRRK